MPGPNRRPLSRIVPLRGFGEVDGIIRKSHQSTRVWRPEAESVRAVAIHVAISSCGASGTQVQGTFFPAYGFSSLLTHALLSPEPLWEDLKSDWGCTIPVQAGPAKLQVSPLARFNCLCY